jgi:hypothetical protein
MMNELLSTRRSPIHRAAAAENPANLTSSLMATQISTQHKHICIDEENGFERVPRWKFITETN